MLSSRSQNQLVIQSKAPIPNAQAGEAAVWVSKIGNNPFPHAAGERIDTLDPSGP